MHDDAVVHVKHPKMGVVVFICNIIWPGFGTVIAGFLAGDEYIVNNLTVGILQFCTAWLLIGWLWSMYTGYKIYEVTRTRSFKQHEAHQIMKKNEGIHAEESDNEKALPAH